jgi:hypothetical protein
MPACAATGRPEPVDEDEGGLVVSPVVGDVGGVAVEDGVPLVLVVVAVDEVGELDVELGEEEEAAADVCCWVRMTTEEALASHLAQGCGFAGRTAKRATPVSQQPAGPLKQQYSGLVAPVTLVHEMRSSPPSCRPNALVSPIFICASQRSPWVEGGRTETKLGALGRVPVLVCTRSPDEIPLWRPAELVGEAHGFLPATRAFVKARIAGEVFLGESPAREEALLCRRA